MKLEVGNTYQLTDLPIGATYSPIKYPMYHFKILTKGLAGQTLTLRQSKTLMPHNFVESECLFGFNDGKGSFGHDWQTTEVRLESLPENYKEQEYVHEPYKRFEFPD